MFELIHEISQSLRRNKLRTFLTGVAVAWGIFIFIVLLGMGNGVAGSFRTQFEEGNYSYLSLWPGWTSKPHKGYKEMRRIDFKDTDMARVAHDNMAHIEAVTSSVVVDSSRVSSPRDYISESVYGHFPSELKRSKLKMDIGRFINDIDIKEQRKVIVLESQNASILFGSPEAAIGQTVKLMGLGWQVVGIYSHDWEKGSYVPFTTAMTITGKDGKVSDLQVRLKNVTTLEESEAVEQSVRQSLASAHDFAVDDKSAIYIWNRFNNYIQNLQAVTILNVAIWLIGILTLLSGIVGVSNIMFVSVRERTHEIGIRRAIGAKPRNIWMQIVAESVAITTLFGYIGIVLGTALSALISFLLSKNNMMMQNATIDISIAIQVTILLIVVGTLAGLFPAIKATKVKPVEALRNE